MRCRGLVLALVFLLGACQYVGEENYRPRAEVLRHYQDRTILYWGNWGAVVYYTPEGDVFLWHGRSRAVLRGQWKLDEDSDSNQVCTRYAPYKYNPITGVDQSEWRCSLLSQEEFYTRDEATGDPLNLARRTAMPFELRSLDAHDIERIRMSLPALP